LRCFLTFKLTTLSFFHLVFFQMSSNEYSHLNELSQLRFLVIDEADRMIKQGSFPQLKQIFEVINQANPPPEDPNEMDEESDDDDEDRLRSLQGVRGEAKVVMLDDSILAAIERERSGVKSAPKPMEMEDDEYLEHLEDDDLDSAEEDEKEEQERVHRQTFVYSATLTLPTSTHHLIKKDPSKKFSKKNKKGYRQPSTVDGAIAEMLELAGAMGETKVVDLSNLIPEGMSQQSKKAAKDKKSEKDTVSSKSSGDAKKPSSVAARLPPGLTLGEIRCAQRHKDSHLYAYLVTTHQGSSGPCLVFCNSIAAVRRVGETLQTLGLPVKMLHAQMAQVSVFFAAYLVTHTQRL
jgi:ATP-dependent RNA helicase DDX24/MAK5